MRIRLLLVCCFPFLIGADAPDPLAGLDEAITAGMKTAEIPGLAIAIVKDDKVVFAKGFGTRKLGEMEPVDAKTLFAIGSTTKPFTAALLAMGVSEGKLNWDDPVSKFMPGIEFSDPLVTRELTVRDLLSHRSGLPDHGGDLLFVGYAYDRHDLIRRIRFLKPDSSFRSRYAYQNLMYMIAGEMAGQIALKPWDQLISERIFIPLGMEDTNTSVRTLSGYKNVATPHGVIDDKVVSINYRNIDSAGGAGCINSNAHDLAIWIRLLLAEGKLEGTTYWKSAQAREMFTPQTVIRLEGPRLKTYPEAHFLNYGLAWFLWDYRGKKIVQHGGNVDGMSAHIGLVPEEKLGVVILANKDFALSTRGLFLNIVDRYLGKTDHDRFAEMWDVEKELRAEFKKKETDTLAKQVKDTKPSMPLEAYAGRYQSVLYGDARVEHADGKLTFALGLQSGEMTHFHYDTFLVTWKNPVDGKALVRFPLTDLGKIAGVRLIELDKPDQGDMNYQRVEKMP